MNYKETRGKVLNTAYIARQRSKKTRWGIERGKVFTMFHLWRWSLGIEHKSTHRVYNWG